MWKTIHRDGRENRCIPGTKLVYLAFWVLGELPNQNNQNLLVFPRKGGMAIAGCCLYLLSTHGKIWQN